MDRFRVLRDERVLRLQVGAVSWAPEPHGARPSSLGNARDHEPNPSPIPRLNQPGKIPRVDDCRLGVATHRAPVVEQDQRMAVTGQLHRAERVAFRPDAVSLGGGLREPDPHPVGVLDA